MENTENFNLSLTISRLLVLLLSLVLLHYHILENLALQ
jgi:hypothetical protein